MLGVAGGLIFYFWRKGWFKPIYTLKEEAKS
jgi:magnesium transporter